MPRYRLTIAYEGTAFHGWQRQRATAVQIAGAGGSPRVLCDDAHACKTPDLQEKTAKAVESVELRTAQRVVQLAVQAVVREPINLQGASRTDSGVHAEAQTAAFTCEKDPPGPPVERLALAINAKLPDDIVVRNAIRVDDDFSPISDCIAKGYRYRIYANRLRPLWERTRVTHVREALNFDAMCAAAEPIVGTHDFEAFTNAGHGRESTVRTVHSCKVTRAGEHEMHIDVVGPGFLYNMVRIIAGTLMDAGRGKISTDRVAEAVATGNRRLAGPTATAKGLCLMWMQYPGDPFQGVDFSGENPFQGEGSS